MPHTQADLFDPPPASHRRGPDTEKQAARKVAPKTGTLRARILGMAHGAGGHGLTAWEAIQALQRTDPKLPDYSVRPRFTELSDGGYLRDSGARRPNDRNNPEVVWILTEKGRNP